jgi:MarR family transcriptional regulator, lower aerobic nicotinate degradation pathway regulator
MKSNKYKTIQRLISYWEEFEENNSNLTIQDFGQWLVQNSNKETSDNNISSFRDLDLDLPVYLKYEQSLDQKNHLLDLISRISRLHEFYIRKFLSNLPINTRLEFVFLYTIDIMESAKKTEVINVHLVEFTTGMDIIKRLLSQGLIVESLNEADKRSKLVHTTEAGKAVLNKTLRQMAAEKEMFLACINSNKWKKIMPTLEELNNFHNSIYLKHNSKNAAELINLVASLRHLNKSSY